MNKTADNLTDAQLGKELVQSALGGFGMGTGAAGLYYLLNGLRTAESPLAGNSVAGFLPGAKTKKIVKKPSRSPESPINAYKTAADSPSFLMRAYQALGSKLPAKYPIISDLLGTGKTEGAKDMWRLAGNIGLAGLGGYAGLSAVNHIADKQRLEDSKDEVDAARQEYFDALTGKKAAVLDAAFDAFSKAADEQGNSFLGNVGGSIDRAFGNYVGKPALLTALATSLIGGTYMYDQVKSRTKAENLRRAAAARARLAGLQKTPYVNPVELAALTKK